MILRLPLLAELLDLANVNVCSSALARLTWSMAPIRCCWRVSSCVCSELGVGCGEEGEEEEGEGG
eukprot:760091-Hanusia_phi.AAC.2